MFFFQKKGKEKSYQEKNKYGKFSATHAVCERDECVILVGCEIGFDNAFHTAFIGSKITLQKFSGFRFSDRR